MLSEVDGSKNGPRGAATDGVASDVIAISEITTERAFVDK